MCRPTTREEWDQLTCLRQLHGVDVFIAVWQRDQRAFLVAQHCRLVERIATQVLGRGTDIRYTQAVPICARGKTKRPT
jgi:hypothetical protein